MNARIGVCFYGEQAKYIASIRSIVGEKMEMMTYQKGMVYADKLDLVETEYFVEVNCTLVEVESKIGKYFTTRQNLVFKLLKMFRINMYTTDEANDLEEVSYVPLTWVIPNEIAAKFFVQQGSDLDEKRIRYPASYYIAMIYPHLRIDMRQAWFNDRYFYWTDLMVTPEPRIFHYINNQGLINRLASVALSIAAKLKNSYIRDLRLAMVDKLRAMGFKTPVIDPSGHFANLVLLGHYGWVSHKLLLESIEYNITRGLAMKEDEPLGAYIARTRCTRKIGADIQLLYDPPQAPVWHGYADYTAALLSLVQVYKLLGIKESNLDKIQVKLDSALRGRLREIGSTRFFANRLTAQ
jgi:hypothetical protein